MALAWIFSVLGLLLTTHVAFFWCCCSCPSSVITITVGGCGGLALSGASVHLTGPNGFDSTVSTNSSGVATFSVTDNGSYSYTVSKSRFNNGTGSVTVTACNSPSASVSLSAASGYVCCSKCPDPIASTLYGSFSGGSVTLSWNGVSKWTGTVDVSHTTTRKCSSGCVGTTASCSTESGSVRVNVQVLCPSTVGGNFGLLLNCEGGVLSLILCPGGEVPYFLDASCAGCSSSSIDTVGTGTNVCGLPVAMSWSVAQPPTWTLGGSPQGNFPLDFPIAGTFTASE